MCVKKGVFCLVIIFLTHIHCVFAGDVEDHAPIGVMGDHYHKAGEWMTSYRYMYMDMPENYSGTKKQSVSQVHGDFPVSPVNMQMEMHMLGVMYGVTDEFTAMLMLPYVIKEMGHRRRDGKEFTTRTEGIGDIRLGGMYSLKSLFKKSVHLNLAVSFPSGSIDEKDETLLGPNRDLPYPMQIGSGTYDAHPGLTYLDKKDSWSWGLQGLSSVRFGKNRHKYRLGNSYEITSWLAYQWAEWISTSIRAKLNIWGNIRGADPRINPKIIPTADPDLRGGERVDLLFGVNLLGLDGKLKDHRLALEVGFPVYQHLKGPQLGVGVQGTVGWQKAF